MILNQRKSGRNAFFWPQSLIVAESLNSVRQISPLLIVPISPGVRLRGILSEYHWNDHRRPLAKRVYPWTTTAISACSFENPGQFADKKKGDKILNVIIGKLNGEVDDDGDAVKSLHKLVDGLLYRKDYDAVPEKWLLCVPRSAVADVISAHHDHSLGGHLGRTKTYDTLKAKYFWPGMFRDVNEYVRSCKLLPIVQNPNPREIWYAADYQSPRTAIRRSLHRHCWSTTGGNQHILSAICRLTKFAFAEAIPDITTETVMGVLFRHFFFTKYVICDRLVSDRGTSLISAAAEEMYSRFGIKHLTTSGYNPPANGQVEKFNHYLSTTLGIMEFENANTAIDRWDEYLPEIVYAYNAKIHTATGFSCTELTFGCKAKMPIDSRTGPPVLEPAVNTNRSAQLNLLQANRELAQAVTTAAQEKSRQKVNQHRKAHSFDKGDEVLIYNPKRKREKGGKLKAVYSGPFKVVKKTNPVNYIVKSSGRPKPAVKHKRYMKPFILRKGISASPRLNRSDIGSWRVGHLMLDLRGWKWHRSLLELCGWTSCVWSQGFEKKEL